MGKVQEFKTNKLEKIVIEKSQDTDKALQEMIFGKYETAEGTSKREIRIVTYAEVDQVGTTGDFFASATVVCTEDNKTEVKFTPPEINEEVPMSASDAIEVDCAGDAGQAELVKIEQKRAMPVGILTRRRELLLAQQAATMALTGKVEHHNGTINLGFTNIFTLAGAYKWDDNSSRPIEQINKHYDEMDEKPDAVFADAKSIQYILRDAVETSNGAKIANFSRAIKADIDRKSKSKTVRFVGTILESGLDVYKVTTKVRQKDGTKTPLIPENTALFAPVDNRAAAKFVYGGIPVVDDALNPNPRTVRQNERWYTSVNDNKTMATVGMLSSPCPVMLNPQMFRVLKVA